MSELIFESPVTIGVTGLAFVIVALVVWINTGIKPALYVSIALLLLTAILLAVSLQVKTDREQITNVLNEVADAVEKNDLAQVLTHIHPTAVEGVLRAKSELPNYKFTQARVTGIKRIEVHPDTNPPSAIAEFNVAVSLNARGNQADGIRRFVRCYFLKRDGRWLVHDYQHFDITEGFRDIAP